jgi:hypothetical protein
MVWRSLVIAGYVVLALAIGFAYGGEGLAMLAFFYCLVGIWAGFILALNVLSREAGRRYFGRLARPR